MQKLARTSEPPAQSISADAWNPQLTKKSAAEPAAGQGESAATGRSTPELLLETAVAQFAELGFEGVSMRTLAEKCSATTTALYYHFGSKEELYAEVCRHKFDSITYVMSLALKQAKTTEQKLEALVATLYDEWHRDNTLLLLTQRDVINALVSPEHCTAGSHYKHLMGIVHAALANHFEQAIDEDFSFTFGSLIYGYCALMSFDQKASTMSRDQYRQHRKKVLLHYCRRIWTSVALSN